MICERVAPASLFTAVAVGSRLPQRASKPSSGFATIRYRPQTTFAAPCCLLYWNLLISTALLGTMQESFIQILEGAMLICFGISWPIDIIHTLRVKHASKKSLLFLVLIIVGYSAGLAAKCCRSSLGHQPIEPVTWLYVVNVALLTIDLALSWYYQRVDAASMTHVASIDEAGQRGHASGQTARSAFPQPEAEHCQVPQLS